MEKGAFVLKSVRATKSFGAKLAKEVLKSEPQTAFLIAMMGDLGSGKTTFLQGFAEGLGVKEKVLSPTFILMRKFELTHFRFKNFYHFDCYRLERPEELLGLGWQEIISNSQNIVAVEWAEKVRKLIPKNSLWLKFQFVNENTRKIVVL